MEKIKKIVFIIDNLYSGGRERQLTELIRGIYLQKKYEILLIVLDSKIHYKEVLSYCEYKIFDREKRFDILQIMKVYAEIYRFKPDLINYWSFFAGVVILPFSIIFIKVKVVNSLIQNSHPLPNSYKKYLYKILFNLSNVNVSNSKSGFVAKNIKYEKKNVVIYNGIDSKRFPFYPSVKSNVQIKIGMVARLNHSKDYDTFFEVIRLISKSHDNITFFVLGEGPLRLRYIKENQDLIQSNKLVFLEVTTNVVNYIKDWSIGLLITKNEGVSNVILEYMATGIPVIATGKGGTPEIIENKVNGIYLSDYSAQAIVNEIISLLSNGYLYEKIKRNAICTIKEKFDYQIMLRSYIAVFDSLLNDYQK